MVCEEWQFSAVIRLFDEVGHITHSRSKAVKAREEMWDLDIFAVERLPDNNNEVFVYINYKNMDMLEHHYLANLMAQEDASNE